MKQSALYKIDSEQNKEIFLVSVDNSLSIGKSYNADICFNDWRTSGIHALIKRDIDGNLVVVDLGSCFGTFVNKKKINIHSLTDGDIINIGSQEIVLRQIKNGTVTHLNPTEEDKLRGKMAKKSMTPGLASENNVLETLFYWGDKLIEHKTFNSGSQITIGDPKKATFGMVLKQFKDKKEIYKLAKYKNGELKLQIPPNAHGVIWSDKKPIALDTLRNYDDRYAGKEEIEISLRIGDSAHIEFGEISLDFRFTKPSEKIPVKLNFFMDRNLKRILLGILAFYFLIFLTFRFFTVEEDEKSLEDIPKRLRKIVYDIGVKNAMEKRQAAIGRIAKTLEGGRAKAEEGRSKTKKTIVKTKPQKVVKKTKTKDDKTLKNAHKASKAAPSKAQEVDLDSTFAESSNVEVLDKAAVLSKTNESGNTVSAMAKGSFARGRTGHGPGGGGKSVGIGSISGNLTGGGMGAGDYGLKPSKGRQIEIKEDEDVQVKGGLDPELIAAIIKRYGPQIQHCYEKGLVRNPKIKGKVTTHFIITADGSVITPKITESSLEDMTTEQCIIGKIKTWKFPRPKGGGTVGVTWPFILMSNLGN